MKYNLFSSSIVVYLCVIHGVMNAYNPRGFSGGVGASGPARSSESLGALRPISPGGSDGSPAGNSNSRLIGEVSDGEKVTSPQQPLGRIVGETGVKDSSEVAEIVEPAPADGILGYENGVGEVEVAENVDCGVPLSLSRITERCPSVAIHAMWNIPSSNKISLLAGGDLYNMREGGRIKVSTHRFNQSMYSGGLCGTIDAAFTSKLPTGTEDYTVYFSENKYSLYKNSFSHVSGPYSINKNYQSGSKTPLQLSFPSWVRKIDAAMTWHNGKVYLFFKYLGVGYFSKYDPKAGKMYESYPRRTDVWWKGSPREGPDAAYYSKTKYETYFIVGNDLYVFKNGGMVTSTEPKSVTGNLVRC